ncbi:hypothetical protein AZE42_12137 [Rhizopogon vesiculosus]|uniref:Uncharacterized protein n=1 Tax=Rhizopogon vesiculosus TaxID=180088 RepID=A0A1J8PQP7_9AGAM|nr:hypothetical protein AZE42_12137 [Rhizopogon vesiculosus]
MIRAPLSIFHSQNVLATAVESVVCAESISKLVPFGETRLPEMTVSSSIQMQVSRGWWAWT